MGYYCVYGKCNSDTRYAHRDHMAGVKFVMFPKDIKKLKRWVYLCGRKNFTIQNIKPWTRICSKHFVNGTGPTDENPDPILATNINEPLPKRRRKRDPSPDDEEAVNVPEDRVDKMGEVTGVLMKPETTDVFSGPKEETEVSKEPQKAVQFKMAEESNPVPPEEEKTEEAKEPSNENSPKKSEDDSHEDAASAAINKFKGELSKIQSSSSDEEDKKTKKKRRNMKIERPVRAPKKRISHFVRETPNNDQYVMKLFDRSVDLSQFDLNTPLYPICRAWFNNNPGSSNKFKKSKRDEKQISKDSYTLPRPAPAKGALAPAKKLEPYPLQEDFEIDYDPDIPLPSKEEMLDEHMQNWVKVRQHFRAESLKRDERYQESLSILRDCYYSRL